MLSPLLLLPEICWGWQSHLHFLLAAYFPFLHHQLPRTASPRDATVTGTLLRVRDFFPCCPLVPLSNTGRKKLVYRLWFVSDLGWVLMLSKHQCEEQMILYKYV